LGKRKKRNKKDATQILWNADKIKSSFTFFAWQHPVRDGISVEFEYPRTDVPLGTQYAILMFSQQSTWDCFVPRNDVKITSNLAIKV